MRDGHRLRARSQLRDDNKLRDDHKLRVRSQIACVDLIRSKCRNRCHRLTMCGPVVIVCHSRRGPLIKEPAGWPEGSNIWIMVFFMTYDI